MHPGREEQPIQGISAAVEVPTQLYCWLFQKEYSQSTLGDAASRVNIKTNSPLHYITVNTLQTRLLTSAVFFCILKICTLYGEFFNLYGIQCIMYDVLCTMHGVHCINYGVRRYY